MRKSTLFAAAGLLAFGTAALAAEGGAGTQNTPGNAAGRMQGSPNAAGFGKSNATGDTTGSTGPGASGAAPDRATSRDGKMHGSPNASGFKAGEGSSAGSSGSR